MPDDFQNLPILTMVLKQDRIEPCQRPAKLREVRRNVKLPAVAILGDGSTVRLRTHSQNRTVAARATADLSLIHI